MYSQKMPLPPLTFLGHLVNVMVWVWVVEAGVCLGAASDHASRSRSILSLLGGL